MRWSTMAFCTTPSMTTTFYHRDLCLYHLFVSSHVIPFALSVLHCTRQVVWPRSSAFPALWRL